MKCKKCNGKGFHKFSQETDIYNMDWMDDGEPMELIEKECFYCEGKGELSKAQLKSKIKIKHSKSLSEDPSMKYIGAAFGEDIYEKDGKRYTEKRKVPLGFLE